MRWEKVPAVALAKEGLFIITPKVGQGSLLSVALSIRSPGAAVNSQFALWSPDFPPIDKSIGDHILYSLNKLLEV